MARSPGTKAGSRSTGTAAGRRTSDKASPAGKDGGAEGVRPEENRAAILAAFLTLLSELSFERIGVGDVAQKAGVSLADLRACYGSTFDMLAAFIRETDRKVLAVPMDDMADQPARDRLFDVLMRRLDVLGPHRAAIRSLSRSARRNPGLAMGLNRLALRSQQWMLEAAGIGSSGLRGTVRAQGLVLLFARVLDTFLDDEEEGLSRTMAALDRELAKGARILGFMERAARLAGCGGRGRRHRPEETSAEPEAA